MSWLVINWEMKCLIVVLIFLTSFGYVHGESQSIFGSKNDNRADLSWKALVRTFNTTTPGIYWNDLPAYPNRRVAYLWTHSVIMQAALDNLNDGGTKTSFLNTLDAVKSYRLEARGYKAYASVLNPSHNQLRYWDDNGITGLGLIHASKILKDMKDQLIHNIEEIWPFIESGMAKDGGVYWRELNPQPLLGISSTGSCAELAVRLLLAEHAKISSSSDTYLEFAEKNLEWLDSHLLDNSTSIYWNSWYENIDDVPSSCATGTHICNWLFTYNQGFVINLLVLLYQYSDTKEEYLEQAVRTAQASVNYFDKDVLWKQPPPFNSIYFRSLLLLNEFRPDTKYIDSMKTYLDLVWSKARDPLSGLFFLGGIGTYDIEFGSIDQAAFVQMFSLLLRHNVRYS